jgi:hypothetical protein
MFLLAFLLLVVVDEPAWKIEITTTGGFTGRGAGSMTVAADGNIVVRPGCKLRLSAEDLKKLGELIEKAKPQEWKASYAVPANPNGCCDMIGYTLTMTRAGTRRTATWYDDHLPFPPDLDAIVSALWGAPAAMRSRYKTQCNP